MTPADGQGQTPCVPQDARVLTPIAALPGKDWPRAGIGPRPEQLWVKVDDLRIDLAYQRGLTKQSRKLIRQMVEHWDWRLVQAVTVAELPGGVWELIDGQHRAIAALTHGGIPLLPATVLPAGTRADAAAAFVAMNSARVAIPAHQRLRAAIQAGDPAATAIARAAQAAGVRLLTAPPSGSNYPAGSCIAATTLHAVLRRAGEAELTEILTICAAAEMAPIDTAALKAVETLRGEAVWRHHDRALLIEALADWETIRDTARQRAATSRTSWAEATVAELYRRCTTEETDR